MIAEQPGMIEGDEEETLENWETEKRGIFARYHNYHRWSSWRQAPFEGSIFGWSWLGWAGMRQDDTRMFLECSICQKLKFQREPNWEDGVDHHLYSLDPLVSLYVVTLGLSKEDESGNQFIIVDNFSKLLVVYPARSTTSKEFVHALLQWVSIFGVPKEIHTNGGSQFSSQLSSDLASLLGYNHLVIVAYHPQANVLVERRNKELLNHLRSLVYEKRIRTLELLSSSGAGNS